MKESRYPLIVFMFAIFIGYSCSSDLNYNQMVHRGLESEVQNDSLFLGYYLGMSSDDFHSHSWELNQQGLITGLAKIYYTFDDLKNRATMEYYPTFREGKIVRMPVSIQYDAWAPWNEQYWPEQLAKDLVEYYGDVYGASFRSVYVPDIERFAQVSIQGNREIRIYRDSDSSVMVEFIDLNVYGKQDS